VHRQHLLLADSCEQFADACIEVLTSDALATDLAHDAREFVSSRFSRSAVIAKHPGRWRAVGERGVAAVDDVRVSHSANGGAI
jgi:hypothetical protein